MAATNSIEGYERLQQVFDGYWRGRRAVIVDESAAISEAFDNMDAKWPDWPNLGAGPAPSYWPAPVVVNSSIIWHPGGVPNVAAIVYEYETTGINTGYDPDIRYCSVYVVVEQKPTRVDVDSGRVINGMATSGDVGVGQHHNGFAGHVEYVLGHGSDIQSDRRYVARLDTVYANGTVPSGDIQAAVGRINADDMTDLLGSGAVAGKIRLLKATRNIGRGNYQKISYWVAYDPDGWINTHVYKGTWVTIMRKIRDEKGEWAQWNNGTAAAGWDTGEDYAIDDIVLNDGDYYRCIQAITGSTAAQEPGTGGSWEDYWVINYLKVPVLIFKRNLEPPAAWDATTAYTAGDIVAREEEYYEAQGNTTGDDPSDDDGTNWQSASVSDALTKVDYTDDGPNADYQDVSTPAWAGATDYDRGEYVDNDDIVYHCHTDHTSAAGNEPGTGGSWEDYWDQADEFHILLDEEADMTFIDDPADDGPLIPWPDGP